MGELVPGKASEPESNSDGIEFALVIARMISSVESDPQYLRQAIYELARHKFQEQFADRDPQLVAKTKETLEAAIRGVEVFSRNHPLTPTSVPLIGSDGSQQSKEHPPVPAWAIKNSAALDTATGLHQSAGEFGRLLPYLRRALLVLAVVVGGLAAWQQRDRLSAVFRGEPRGETLVATPVPPPRSEPKPPPAPEKPAMLLPTDYGIYALSDEKLFELQQLPGRAPDMRVAVSAPIKTPSVTILPNGHPKFIVFRRDAASNNADRAEVRIIAKIAREFSAESAGKKTEGEITWVMRNISTPFRLSPIKGAPEMYEVHSEDPAVELSPGRYALVMKGEAYDFTVSGNVVDARQCIERIEASNGTFFSECRKP